MYRGWEWFIKEEAHAKGGMKETTCRSIEVENKSISSHSISTCLSLRLRLSLTLNKKAVINMPLGIPKEADSREVRMEKNCRKSNSFVYPMMYNCKANCGKASNPTAYRKKGNNSVQSFLFATKTKEIPERNYCPLPYFTLSDNCKSFHL